MNLKLAFVYINKIKRVVCLKAGRILLKCFYIYPVVRNKIVFMSYQGEKYACNPRCVSEYLQKNNPGKYEVVWVFRNPEHFCCLENLGIRIVKYGTFQYYKEILTAKVFLYNMRIPEMLPFRKSQTTISTGHGGGAYKHLLLDVPGIGKMDRILIKMSEENTTVYVSTNKRYTECVVRNAYGHRGEVLECGMPRNDVLVQKKYLGTHKVHDYYNIPENVKIVLYAPTYRKKDTRIAEDYGLDTERLLKAVKQRFGGEWAVLYRLHYFVKAAFSDSAAERGIIDATDYSDMQDLMMEADILITDYSSSMWDFTLTGKPGFLYAADLDKYTEKTGFYTEIKDWPFYLAASNDELERKILDFDDQDYQSRIRKHYRELEICETGRATEIVSEYIDRKCFGET